MLLYHWLLTITACLPLVYLISFLIKYAKKKLLLKRICTPDPSYFIIGNLPIIMSEPDKIFSTMRGFAEKHYPIFRLSTFYVDIINLLDPRDIELILSSTKHLTKSKVYTFLINWLGTGLLTSTGAKWHSRRKILTPAFHFSILQEFLKIFNEETNKLVEQLDNDLNSDSFDVIPYVTHFTLQSIGETAMGLTEIDEGLQKSYREAIYAMGKIVFDRLSKPWLRSQSIYEMSELGKRERKVVEVLHNFSNGIIQERERNKIEPYSKRKRLAMLDLLLRAKESGADIDWEGIREEVDTFMFEGHDTTAMAISFLLLCLANLPEIQGKVRDEIIKVLGPNMEKQPDSNDLQMLKYTERFIKETLRLFPSVPLISRFASEDLITATGYSIPKGTILHMHIYDVHRNPRFYPDPLKFDPDRFLPEVANERNPFAYIPFSAGPRNCIGQRFAMMELKTVLCGILRKFELHKVDDMSEIQFRPDLVLRPSSEIKIKITSL